MKDSNQIQQHFSSEKQPTLWRALPALEELQSTWEKKRDSPTFNLYKDALSDGLEKLKKYYFRLDEKPSFVLALGKFQHILFNTFYYLFFIFSPSSLLQVGLHQGFMGRSSRKSSRDSGRE